MFERIFAIVGIVFVAGAALFFLGMVGATRPIEFLWNRIKNVIHRWRYDFYVNGVKRGIRYRLGVRLLLPYLDARYTNAKEQLAKMQTEERPLAGSIERSIWDHRYEKTAGRIIELKEIAKLEGDK